MAQKIVPCLWFDGAAEEAARFYTSLLPDSHIDKVVRAPAAYPAGEAGAVLVVEFTLAGMRYIALNAGPQARFTTPFPSRSTPRTRPRPIGCGTRSLPMAAPSATAAGVRTAGACAGRSCPAAWPS